MDHTTHRFSSTLLALIVAVVALAPRPSSAQCPDLTIDGDLAARVGLRLPEIRTRADLDAAAQLAARARVAFDGGARLDALADLEAAWDRSLDVDLLGMLGLSLQAAGRLPEAWIALHRFEMEASADAWARLGADVRAALGELDAQLGGVRLRGDLGALGQVYVDGELVTWLPFDGAIRLPDGAVTVEIRALGHLARTFDLNVTAGAVSDLDVALPRIDADFVGDMGLRAPALHARADLDAAGRLMADLLARFQAGARAELVADLEAAFQRSGDVDILGALGLALRAAGRLPEAWIALSRFKLEGSAALWARLGAEVDAALGEIDAQLPGIRLGGDFGVRGEVWIDGRLAARLPFDGVIRVAPGDVSLEVRGLGRIATDLNVSVAAGAIATPTVTLPTIASALTPAMIDLSGITGLALSAPTAAVGGLGFDAGLVIGVTAGITGVLLLVGGLATGFHADLNAQIPNGIPPVNYDFTGTDIAGVFELLGWIGGGIGIGVITIVGILAATIGSAAPDLPDLDCDDLARAPEPTIEWAFVPWASPTVAGGAFELRF